MPLKRIMIASACVLALGTLSYFFAGHQAPSGQAALASLTRESVPAIENAFNAAKSDVRVLVLLSPT